MGWLVREFECGACGNEWEDLLKPQEKSQACPKCGAKTKFKLSAPGLALYSIADKAGKNAILQKRSTQHTIKEVSREAEKFGEAGVQLSKLSGKIQSR